MLAFVEHTLFYYHFSPKKEARAFFLSRFPDILQHLLMCIICIRALLPHSVVMLLRENPLFGIALGKGKVIGALRDGIS